MAYDRIGELIRLLADPGCRPILGAVDGKTCARCKQRTPRAGMMASNARGDGMGSYCLPCNVEQEAEWYALNPEKGKAKAHRYHRRLGENGGDLSGDDIMWLLDQANHRCLVCGTTDRPELDHVVPVSRGGRSTRTNMQILCRRHNAEKGSKTTDYRGRAA